MITINFNLFLLIMMIMIMFKFVFTWSLVSSSSYHWQKKRFLLDQQHLTSFNSTPTLTNVSTSMNRRRSSATKLKKNHDGYNSDVNKLDLDLGSNSLEFIKKNNFRVTSLIGKTVTLTCSIELDEVEFTKAANYRVTSFLFFLIKLLL